MTEREKMNAGKNIVGTMTNILAHPDLPKIFKTCGFDFFIGHIISNFFN